MRLLTLIFVLLLTACVAGAAATSGSTLARPGGTRGPYEVAFTPDGRTALVSEWDEGTLAAIDTATGEVRRRYPTGGENPAGVAISPTGELAAVANSFSGSIALITLESGETRLVDLPGMPYDVVFAPGGDELYASVSQLDAVAVIDPKLASVTARMPTARRPRSLSLTPDGRVLAAGCMSAGAVTFLAPRERRVLGQGETPAVNLRGVALYDDGGRAYAVAQRAQNERPTRTAVGIWSNQAFEVRPGGNPNGAKNIWLDLIGQDVADPDSVVLDLQRGRALITCAGGDSLNALPLRGGSGAALTALTSNPRGLALTPDGSEIWVCGHLGNEIVIVDAAELKLKRRIALGPPSKPDPEIVGRALFSSASLAKGAQFSCASCHPDGHTDGISWKFTHVPDALGIEIDRNVRSLRGGLAETGPLRWSGLDARVDEFVRDELKGLFENETLSEEKISALASFASTRPLPPNPHRATSDAATVKQGQTLFTGKAGCIRCHAGPASGGGVRAWVGTTPEAVGLETPHLRGVYDSDPYLHDGSARNLDEIFSKRNAAKRHGDAHLLTPDELAAVLIYVRTL